VMPCLGTTTESAGSARFAEGR